LNEASSAIGLYPKANELKGTGVRFVMDRRQFGCAAVPCGKERVEALWRSWLEGWPPLAAPRRPRVLAGKRSTLTSRLRYKAEQLARSAAQCQSHSGLGPMSLFAVARIPCPRDAGLGQELNRGPNQLGESGDREESSPLLGPLRPSNFEPGQRAWPRWFPNQEWTMRASA
jgi:hypothetical protein